MRLLNSLRHGKTLSSVFFLGSGMQFFAAAIVGFALILCLAAIFGKDEHDECDAAIENFRSLGEQNFTVALQDQYRKVIDAHASGEYETCIDLANKGSKRFKQE